MRRISMPNKLLAPLLALALAPAAFAAESAGQTITRAGTKASSVGPEQFFTGRIRLDPLYDATDSINASGAYVTFEPGARSAWHTHPKGQYLIVTQGVGRTGEWGKPVQEIKPGDVVWCPPGVKHWHGAAPNTAMMHLTVTGHDEKNQNVTWMEKVSDEQYNAR
ncbi:MAG: cupin [Cupriavidus sp.]|nr:cupin [Cupriavidus sp.]